MRGKQMDRRNFVKAAALGAAGLCAPAILVGRADASVRYTRGLASDYGNSYVATNFEAIEPRFRKQMVQYYSDEPEGTIVIDTRHHYLYWVWENNTALRYGISVGKEGFQWFGRARVARKTRWPRWTPPPEMRQRSPELPEFMDAGPKNPLGPRALYLYNEKGDTGYRIHGTVSPSSIGRDASSGCIRMFNEDAIDLYRRCPVGTAVLVLQHIADRAGGSLVE